MLHWHFFRCEDFLIKCEVESMNGIVDGCCRHIFDPEPIIYTDGVCFISKTFDVSNGYYLPYSHISVTANIDLYSQPGTYFNRY